MCVCWCQVEPNKSESGAVLPTFVNNRIKKEVAFFCPPPPLCQRKLKIQIVLQKVLVAMEVQVPLCALIFS